jgi:hypothetical protein
MIIRVEKVQSHIGNSHRRELFQYWVSAVRYSYETPYTARRSLDVLTRKKQNPKGRDTHVVIRLVALMLHRAVATPVRRKFIMHPICRPVGLV